MNDAQSYPNFLLTVSSESLTAHLTASNEPCPLTLEKLNQAVASHHLTNTSLEQSAVSSLLAQSRINQNFSIEIAKLLDAELEVKISADNMTAVAEMTPARGGKLLNAADVINALLAEGVTESLIDTEAIDELLRTTDPTTVARGREVEHGFETKFIAKFFLEENAQPAINEQNFAEFFETKHYVCVAEGDELVSRTPATAGIDGVTVLGKKITAKKGKELQFKKYPGTIVSEDNKNLLIATIEGHPILETQGARVDPMLVVKKANLESGNINFDGSVIVNGDVFPQVTIIASGDIYVKGTVENATLKAGNSIIIGGGVISESTPNIDEPPKITTQLCAKKDIHAKFLNLTRLNAGNNLIVSSYAMNSELTVGQSISLGENGGKGTLIGGKTIAGHSITAQTLGSSAYINTMVECGRFHDLKTQLSVCEALIRKRVGERAQLRSILQSIRKKSSITPKSEFLGEITLDRTKKIRVTIAAISTQLRGLRKEQRALKEELQRASTAFVQVNRALFPRVSIKLNGNIYNQQQERAKTRVSFKNEQLHIE